jgi:alcohol-forming fatty acyl-CoA reductase
MTVEQILDKLDVISGDCEKINLAMSDEDRQTVIENVSIIYHFAATIRFDEKMKKAVEMNVRGTREIIKLANECKKLEMFGHMSTSYCHLHIPFLLEKVRKLLININLYFCDKLFSIQALRSASRSS